MKNIIIVSNSTPEKLGYNDKYTIVDSNEIIEHGECSCCPNPNNPKNNYPWDKSYGFISCGDYKGVCVIHGKYKKCISLNNGGNCPSRNANVNHNGAKILDGVFIHCGQSKTWRGSAGCVTLPPDIYNGFIDNFEVGEKLEVNIISM